MSSVVDTRRSTRTRVVAPVTKATRQPAPPLPTGHLAADPVPDAFKPQPVPLVRLLLPTVMVLAVLGMVVLMVRAGGGRQLNPGMLMFPLMMLASVAMMFQSGTNAEDPNERRRTYLRHLRHLRVKAQEHAAAQRAHETHCHPAPDQLRSFVRSDRLWERAGEDEDALEVRIGTGTVSLCTPIEVPETLAPEDVDPVCAVSLRQLLHAVGQLPDMPVVVQLQAFRFVALSGTKAREMARALVLQLACHHGPETLGLSVLGEGWDWLKWLPHTQDPRAARFHVLLVDSVTTTGLEDFFHDDTLTTIIDVAALRTTALGVRAEQEGLFLLVDEQLRVLTEQGDEVLGLADALSEAVAASIARVLASYRRPAGTTTAHSADGDLLRLLGYRDLEHLAAQLWPGRTGAQRLAVPIGIDKHGAAVTLDIKESAHGGAGPHGLCIGATGSGKSEMLRTFVTSLAATHSPDELNLVLVDFKGGATFLGCETLPHTAAVITNLEEESFLVDRMFAAISGEMNRRQELLRAAGNFANVGDYNADAQAVAAHGPLPALVIVVDEFSELLGQHPDFADLFVAVGRLGRSLHVHLLLASQRLEEGRLRGLDSHLSYRVGLKTFSAAESRQVLGVTDAYSLPAKPGAGYLKTGPDDPVRMQASYVSGPLARRIQAAQATQTTPRVELFVGWDGDTAPAAALPAAEPGELTELDHSTTLLDSVVDIARAEATARGQSAHRMWLPPLPAVIELPEVLGPALAFADAAGAANAPGAPSTGPGAVPGAPGAPSTGPSAAPGTDGAPAAGPPGAATSATLLATIGVVDRPYHQRQDPLELDLSTGGGHLAVCGGPQSGKSTALRTVLTSLCARYSPQRVQFYVLDFGGGQLATCGRLPHVRAVANRHEAEKARRIIDEVHQQLADATAGATAPAAPAAEIFLVVDGWHHVGTAGAEYEDLGEKITQLAADGPSVGIHVVVSTARWTTMRPAIRDLMSHRLELRLGEPMDSLIDRHAQAALPVLPGRGINPQGEPMLIARSSNQDLAHVADTWAHLPAAPALRMLPARLDLRELHAACGAAGIPFALGGPRLAPIIWDPATSAHVVCIGSSGAGKSTTLRSLMHGICARGRAAGRIVLVDLRRAHLGALPTDMLAAYAAQTSAAEEAIRNTVATLRQRLPGAEVTPEQLARRDWWEGPDIYVCIDDVDLLGENLLHPLIELLPHARDIGMHVVVTRKSGGVGRALYGGFLAAVRDQQPSAIILDADKDEGPIFGIKPTPQPVGRGRLVLRGEDHGVVQIAHCGEDPVPEEGESHA
ncbi:type VII secretion protein EccCa [Corynebacterium lizhenjunii]|uniref:Type VII secretion protein EccCa n=1 Tax=Corynebacterium lizhenjunii TaxID=2709394 RepID=A0A7T0PA77_9CORY|nr:type VII secretion protein EccCa [Corynebacterium lizhenjunii]QPK79588.1 type VII secretion protein EccCa [Corynebacterium lizhenjunii]